jgi:hypothetical protein
MEEKTLKRKKEKKGFLGGLFKDRKKRYLAILLLALPFLVAIGIFGSIVYREGKSLINLAKGNTVVEVKPENIIESLNYTLRDNPTELQRQYFAELKSAIEDPHEEPIDDATIAGMVAKNYITDFYTWTNKYGKYDVGGMEYIYDGEFENSDHYKENVYLWAKDGFYKYMSAYATQYGKENLLEVTDVQVTSRKMSDPYVISEHSAWKQDDNGDWYDYRIDEPYEWYLVQCNWTYKDTDKLDLSKFSKSINLAIIKRKNGRFEVVEASENTINARKSSTENTAAEGSDGE